ncbi:hypothetical protein B9479_006867 [Cryptococcus floricola]|uniref:Uncharacterized protein n=1 Tax=Cryptococcus floricola TaxID=2591691 RepID=A0A5D3ANZ7_9TREE|nr:hypothetical protein B9479_006867 [Cryptococcus floricola]
MSSNSSSASSITTLYPLPKDVTIRILELYIATLPSESPSFRNLLYASHFCYKKLALRRYEHVAVDQHNSERFFVGYCDSLLRADVSFVPSSTAFSGSEIIYKPIPASWPESRGSTHPSALICKITLVDGAAVIRCQMARKKIQTQCSLTLQPPPTERPSVALFPNLEWLVIPSSMRGHVALIREGHIASIHTREEPYLRAYDALQDIDALQSPRLCVTDKPHTNYVRAINRAYTAHYTHQLEELSVHGTIGGEMSIMSQNRMRVLNVAFAIPAATREAEAEAGDMLEEWGEDTQLYGPEVQPEVEPEVHLRWHLNMLHYSEQDSKTS